MSIDYAIWKVGGHVLAVGQTEEEVGCNYVVYLEDQSGGKVVSPVDVGIGYYMHGRTPCGTVVLTKCTETIYLEFRKGRTNFPREFRHGLLCYRDCLNEEESNEIAEAQTKTDLLNACKVALPFLKDYLRTMDMNTRDNYFLKMENMIVMMGKAVIKAREG